MGCEARRPTGTYKGLDYASLPAACLPGRQGVRQLISGSPPGRQWHNNGQQSAARSGVCRRPRSAPARPLHAERHSPEPPGQLAPCEVGRAATQLCLAGWPTLWLAGVRAHGSSTTAREPDLNPAVRPTARVVFKCCWTSSSRLRAQPLHWHALWPSVRHRPAVSIRTADRRYTGGGRSGCRPAKPRFALSY